MLLIEMLLQRSTFITNKQAIIQRIIHLVLLHLLFQGIDLLLQVSLVAAPVEAAEDGAWAFHIIVVGSKNVLGARGLLLWVIQANVIDGAAGSSHKGVSLRNLKRLLDQYRLLHHVIMVHSHIGVASLILRLPLNRHLVLRVNIIRLSWIHITQLRVLHQHNRGMVAVCSLVLTHAIL